MHGKTPILRTLTAIITSMAVGVSATTASAVETPAEPTPLDAAAGAGMSSGPSDGLVPALAPSLASQLQASSTTPVYDARIAALWEYEPYDGEPATANRRCTANKIGPHTWITAQHCIPDAANYHGYLQQHTGARADITRVWVRDDTATYDVAILHTKNGMEPNVPAFELPTRQLRAGDVGQIIGYATGHDYASAAYSYVLRVRETFNLGNPETWYQYGADAKTTTPSRTCPGDSGAGFLMNNTIYAVHTSGEPNSDCSDRIRSDMLHTTLYPHRDWIEQVVEESENMQDTEGAGEETTTPGATSAAPSTEPSVPATTTTIPAPNGPSGSVPTPPAPAGSAGSGSPELGWTIFGVLLGGFFASFFMLLMQQGRGGFVLPFPMPRW